MKMVMKMKDCVNVIVSLCPLSFSQAATEVLAFLFAGGTFSLSSPDTSFSFLMKRGDNNRHCRKET